MAKIIRPTYPMQFSIGILIIIFIVSSLLSIEIFVVHWTDLSDGNGPFVGMALAGLTVVIMVLIVWEEILFPVYIKPTRDEIIFRNHFTKLKTELLIYCVIPFCVVFNFLTYEIRYIPFAIWAAICILTPLGKLISGIKNFNDFLKLTNDTIEYKNNKKQELIPVAGIKQIVLIKDQSGILHKVQVDKHDARQTIIDLDEMELEAYLHTIDEFIKSHYEALVK